MAPSPRSVTTPRSLLRDERIRFLLVGGFNTVFGYAVFVAAVATVGEATHYLVALLVSHVVAVLVAFAGHRWIVFRVRGSVLRDLVRFWSVYGAILGVNVLMLPLLVEVAGVPVLAAQAVFIVLTVVSSWLGHKHFSFRR